MFADAEQRDLLRLAGNGGERLLRLPGEPRIRNRFHRLRGDGDIGLAVFCNQYKEVVSLGDLRLACDGDVHIDADCICSS